MGRCGLILTAMSPSLFGGKFAAVVIDDAHLEAGRGLAHRAGLDFERREIGAQQHRLRLAIAIANGHARRILPDLDDLWIERLACSDAVAQRLRWVGFHVGHRLIEYHHAIGRRRRAERGDGVLVQHLQRFDGVELAARILDEHGRAHHPGAKQVAPRGFRPAHFRKVPVQVVLVQVEPVFAGDGMADRVAGVSMQHHLGVADRAGGEVDQAGIVASAS